MKIQIVSDLHLEFLNSYQTEELAYKISNSPAETLILAGDICSFKLPNIDNLYSFLDIVEDRFENIIYVVGNHEYYGCSFKEVQCQILILLTNYHNVHTLENNQITIDYITFYGTTLWFEENVDTSMFRQYLNDYRCIQDFNPDAWSRKAIQFIKNVPDDDSKKVLITHHVPHSRFIYEKYVGNDMNCFYLNEIGKFLGKFDLVTFGHSHESVNYQFSDRCRAISNPRGYVDSGNEGSNDKFQYQLIVEV
jgi:predicted phosphodiesterase